VPDFRPRPDPNIVIDDGGRVYEMIVGRRLASGRIVR